MEYTEYVLIEHRPRSEAGGCEFRSSIKNLQDIPELWEQECPYSFRYGRIVTIEEAENLGWI